VLCNGLFLQGVCKAPKKFIECGGIFFGFLHCFGMINKKWLLIGLVWSQMAFAQLPALPQQHIAQCLAEIAHLQQQIPAGMAYGLLPTYRVNGHQNGKAKVDNSAFYTGLVLNILHTYRSHFDAQNQLLADSIIRLAQPAIAKYRHWQGKPTYFYWPADTLAYFPNSFFGAIAPKKRYLPDDIDASVILLQAAAAGDSLVHAAHQYFQRYVANDSFKANSTLPAYKNIGAYSTWLGRGMPVDFDVCVLANVLHFVDSHQLGWTAADSASAGLILQVINNREYLSHAAFMAPHYGRPSILIYHFAKWAMVDRAGWLVPWRKQLIDDAQILLQSATSPLEMLLLKTAIVQLGGVPNSPKAAFDWRQLAEDDFAFFRANIAAYLPAAWRKSLDSWGAISFRFYCPAFNYAILLQYLVLANRQLTKTPIP
jgi:hypothetical protein